jgi:hypothetical protein
MPLATVPPAPAVVPPLPLVPAPESVPPLPPPPVCAPPLLLPPPPSGLPALPAVAWPPALAGGEPPEPGEAWDGGELLQPNAPKTAAKKASLRLDATCTFGSCPERARVLTTSTARLGKNLQRAAPSEMR